MIQVRRIERLATKLSPRSLSSTGNQMDFLSADTGNAFTTVFAGLAATTTSLPNINLFPALVAGFFLVLIMTKPGTTNLPTVFTCFAAISARASTILEQSDFFTSDAAARASAMPPLESALPAALVLAFIAFIAVIFFITFMAFMAAFFFITFMAFMAAFFFITFMAFIALAIATRGFEEGCMEADLRGSTR